jgi:hypothetical protein
LMRSRLAEGGALAMRLSPVCLDAARFAVVEAKTEVSLASPNGGVDQRKSPGWHADELRARSFASACDLRSLGV